MFGDRVQQIDVLRFFILREIQGNSPFFIGDEYHSFYLGANAHLYQDRLVFMTGVENVILNDEAGGDFNTEAWIWHTGLKASF